MPRVLTVLAALSAAPALVAGPAAAAAPGRCVPAHWVGAWGAAPASPAPGYDDQTLRMVVAPHAAGRVARIRLTNRFGTGPVTFDAVRVARLATGAAVAPGTSRTVMFGGRRSVTVARGADTLSDPVRIRVRASEDLVVSVFAGGATGPATIHPVASEPATYVAAGDHTGDRDGAAFGPPSVSWPFLAGVDVRAPGRAGAVVAVGDSITDGFQSTVARPAGTRNTRWPDVLARRLLAAPRPLSVVNEGISGNRILRDALPPIPAIFGPRGLSRLDDDVLAVPGVTDVIVLEGINDLGQPPPASAAQVIAGLRRVATRLRRARLRVLLGTLTPSGGDALPSYGSAAADRTRRAVNRWIRRTRRADGVVDFDRAVRDPRHPGRLRPRFDSGDHLHPNARGYRAMGAAVDLTALAGPRCAAAGARRAGQTGSTR